MRAWYPASRIRLLPDLCLKGGTLPPAPARGGAAPPPGGAPGR